MKKLLLLIIILSCSNISYAFGINAAAINTVKYNQASSYANRRNNQKSIPYLYSPQQAKYYGVNVVNPNAQYRQYGIYRQNYSTNTTNYSQQYNYHK